MKNKILSIPPGTEDVYGQEMRKRETVMTTIKTVYETYGFEPLHTPIIEYRNVFKGHHGEGEKIQFHFTDQTNNKLMLRYDLTVPLARFMAIHPEIPRPFKRYQLASSFRDDSVDCGHHREFVQCDADVVGSTSLATDTEVVMMAVDGMRKLGFVDFKIRINHRGIIRAMVDMSCGFGSDILPIQRALDYADKYAKKGVSGIKEDLLHRGMSKQQASSIIAWLQIKGSPSEILSELFQRFIGHYWARQSIGDLRTILECLPNNYRKFVTVDLSLARGADYYTGFILEGIVPDIHVGAVLGGGRYDNLMEKFSGVREPAVGMAFGLERILDAMSQLSISVESKTNTVLLHPSTPTMTAKAARVATTMRRSGIYVDFCPNILSTTAATCYALKRGHTIVITWKEKPYCRAINTNQDNSHMLKLCRRILHSE